MPTILNARQEHAAQLVAADFLTDAAIALAVGISRRTLEYWKAQPVFRKRVEEIRRVHRRLCMREFCEDIDRELDKPDAWLQHALAIRKKCERMIEIEIEKRESAALLLQNPGTMMVSSRSKVRGRIRRKGE